MINNPAINIEDNNINGFEKCKNDEIILVANTPSDILQKNEKRVYAAFVNNSKFDVTLVLGRKSEATINKGIVLKPSGSFVITQINLYVGIISAISADVAKISYVECKK